MAPRTCGRIPARGSSSATDARRPAAKPPARPLLWPQDMSPIRRRGPVLLGAAVLLACAFAISTLLVDRFGQRPGGGQADAIVVLGARVLPGGVASGPLRARTERAVALFHEGRAPRLIFSGGVGENPPSEAEVMRRIARTLGVPDSACLLEEQSHSTYDNARFTAALLRERGLSKAIVVSDPYHLFRARQHFWREGIFAVPEPAPLTERNDTLARRAWWTAREVLALVRRPGLLFARPPETPRTRD